MNISNRIKSAVDGVDLEDDVFFTEGLNEEVVTESDVADAAAATASLQAAMSALSSTKQILEDSLGNGGVQSDAAPAIGLVMQVAQNVGIEPASIAAPAMESYGITGTRIDATNIALESITETIKNGAKKLWEKVVELLGKLLNYIKTASPVRKQKVEQIKQNLKPGKVYHVRTPVVSDDLTSVFYFPLELVKNLGTDLERFVATVNKINKDTKGEDKVLSEIETVVDVIIEDIDRAIYSSCKQNVDKSNPHIKSEWIKTKQITVGANEASKVENYIKVVEVKTVSVYTQLNKLRELARVWSNSTDFGDGSNRVATQILKVANLAKSVLLMANPNSIVVKIDDPTKKEEDESVKKTNGVSVESDTPEFDLESFSSLWQGVKSFFGGKRKGDGLKEGSIHSNENVKAIEPLKKLLTSQFLNDDWLKKQLFVTGQVDLGGLAKHLELKGQLADPLNNVAKADSNYKYMVSVWGPVLKKVDDEVQKIDARTNELAKGKVGDALVELYKEQTLKLNALRKSFPFNKFPTTNNELLGNTSIVVKDNRLHTVKEVKEGGVTKVKALDAAGVKQAAIFIMKIIDGEMFAPDALAKFNCRWLDHDDGGRILAEDEDVCLAYYNTFYYQSAWYWYEEGLTFAANEVSIIKALFSLMELSVSGTAASLESEEFDLEGNAVTDFGKDIKNNFMKGGIIRKLFKIVWAINLLPVYLAWVFLDRSLDRRAVKQLVTNNKNIQISKPADGAAITELEEESGVRFGQQYRAMLQKFGCLKLEGKIIHGIANGKDLDVLGFDAKARGEMATLTPDVLVVAKIGDNYIGVNGKDDVYAFNTNSKKSLETKFIPWAVSLLKNSSNASMESADDNEEGMDEIVTQAIEIYTEIGTLQQQHEASLESAFPDPYAQFIPEKIEELQSRFVQLCK